MRTFFSFSETQGKTVRCKHSIIGFATGRQRVDAYSGIGANYIVAIGATTLTVCYGFRSVLDSTEAPDRRRGGLNKRASKEIIPGCNMIAGTGPLDIGRNEILTVSHTATE